MEPKVERQISPNSAEPLEHRHSNGGVKPQWGKVREALGLIETRGEVPLVAAVDAAIKAAQVRLASFKLVGGGLINATVRGDVGAVRAATDAALGQIRSMGAIGMVHVIARPDAAVWTMLEKDGLIGSDSPPSGGGNMPPAVRKEAEVPAVRVEGEVPAVREEAEVPAVRAESEVPMIPVKPPAPAAKPAKNPAQKADKPKKPRKPGKK